MFIKLIYIGLALFLSVYFFISNENMDKEIILIILILTGICTTLFFYKKERNLMLKGQFFKHSTFAVAGLLIVNFQYLIDYLIGNILATNIYIFVDQKIVIKSLTLSTIGLLLFFVGYLSYKKRTVNIKPEKIYNTKFLEIFVFISLVLYFYNINLNYVLGGYGVVDRGSLINYIELFLKIFTISIIIQKSRNLILEDNKNISIKKYLLNLGIVVNISLALYLLTVLLSGDRGPLIMFSLIVFGGYLFVTKRKFEKKYGFLLFLAGASIITLLGVARTFGSGLSFTDKVQLAFQENPFSDEESFLPQTKELAGSIKATHHAVDFVPERHDFMWGRFQFQQITTTMPFFNAFNNLLFEDTSKRYAGSASFVTWIFQGDNPTSGNGTSVIADFYLDFGLIGVIVGMFFFGYYMRFAELKMYSQQMPGLFATSFFMVYIGAALFISRSSFLFEFRTVIWVYVVLLVNRQIFNRNPSRVYMNSNG
jgi:oligosaccharide repeat unit polymerase